jgi:hypothetical protein
MEANTSGLTGTVGAGSSGATVAVPVPTAFQTVYHL